jgi:hypothetical protein
MSANGHKQTHAVQLKLIHTVSFTFVSQLHRLGQFAPVRQSITDKPPGGPLVIEQRERPPIRRHKGLFWGGEYDSEEAVFLQASYRQSRQGL